MTSLSETTILVTGTTGQVGFELMRSLQGLGRIVALDRHGLDLGDIDQIRRVMREVRPTLVVNAAAYTAVDDAESNNDLAYRINEKAPGVLAEEAKRLNAVLVHYSTDYVFDGTKSSPYTEEDAPNPINVYGASKLAGERAIEQTGALHLILRTSWVYSLFGRNFLLTMKRLAVEGKRLRIVADQVGAPTWSRTIAEMTAHIAAVGLKGGELQADWWRERSGLYHLSAAGVASWYDFARTIFEYEAPAVPPVIEPISTADFPVRARRPSNSQLSHEKLTRVFGLYPPEWHEALQLCLGINFVAPKSSQ